MTRIGVPTRIVRDVPEPIKVPRVPVPYKVPEKEPVPVRGVPGKEPDKRAWGRIGMAVEEIPYSCPRCGGEMTMEDEILYCPEHGVVYVG